MYSLLITVTKLSEIVSFREKSLILAEGFGSITMAC